MEVFHVLDCAFKMQRSGYKVFFSFFSVVDSDNSENKWVGNHADDVVVGYKQGSKNR